MKPEQRVLTRFATIDDVLSPAFRPLIEAFDKLTVQYQLPDHSDVNQERYPWSIRLVCGAHVGISIRGPLGRVGGRNELS